MNKEYFFHRKDIEEEVKMTMLKSTLFRRIFIIFFALTFMISGLTWLCFQERQRLIMLA